MLVTADVVELCANIPHDLCLEALREILQKGESQLVSADDLIKIKMTKFVLENNYFEVTGTGWK